MLGKSCVLVMLVMHTALAGLVQSYLKRSFLLGGCEERRNDIARARRRNQVKVPPSFSPTLLREDSIFPGREITAVYKGTSGMQLVRRLSRFAAREESPFISDHLN